ncbi:phospholipase D-like domain-containing protein [Methylopila sp. M107]|uniref:phospholipase D-like domain-containing protein n=1 Tax=Methylopila sp. M107 TaxID=1101190 RepID=UPI00037FC73D|nr:phospholipase D-like domain-containing protein [Methylopila sp. M107]
MLNKRDVRAAIGWIGVAWLSPFLGAALYLGFGVNRVHRKARRLRGLKQTYGGDGELRDPAETPRERLQVAVGAITGFDLQQADVDQILHSGDEAYPRMLAAIAGAQASVALSTFIFRLDEPGRKFIDALVAAHKRGVEVRVLIDGMGGGFFRSAAYRALRAEGVPAARFLHSVWPWRMPLLDLRLHKKALIVDGRVAFVGGLNIAAENLVSAPADARVRDAHFRVVGDVVRQIADGFDDDWAFATREDTSDISRPASRAQASGEVARAIASGPDQAVGQLTMVLLSAISSAQRSIRIATPYFLPDEQLLTALSLASFRGVDVRLVTPAKNNHPWIAWATRAHIRPLLESGCSLYHSPPPFDHSKLMTVDEEWSLIGSANWDARSLRLNFELAIEVYDREFSGRVSALIDEKCAAPVRLSDIDGRLFVTKLRDATIRLALPYL